MSAHGMLLTVLCTQLAQAVAKDEAPEVGGFDLSAGMFGPNVSQWLRDTAEEFSQAPAKPGLSRRLETIITGCALVDEYNERQVWGDLWAWGDVYIFNAVLDTQGEAAWQDGFPPNTMKALHVHPLVDVFHRRGVIVVQRCDAHLNPVAEAYIAKVPT